MAIGPQAVHQPHTSLHCGIMNLGLYCNDVASVMQQIIIYDTESYCK